MLRRTIALFTDVEDETLVESFGELLAPHAVQVVPTLEAAVGTASDLLILYLPGRNVEERVVPDALVDDLKRKKVLAVGFTGGRVFDELDLQIGAGFSHRESLPRIRVEPSELLGETGLGSFEALTGPVREEHCFVGVSRDLVPFVDVIAVCEWDWPGTEAAVLRQGTFTYAAIAERPDQWSSEYRSLFRRTAHALAASAFEAPRFEMPTTPPGVVHMRLPPVPDEGAFRVFYFKLYQPTNFTATLEHTGTSAAQMLFFGEKGRLYASIKQAEKGEPLTISANISRQAIEKNAERYWILGVGNYDHDNAADMTLSIRYNMDGDNEPALQSLPSDASHEFLADYLDSLADSYERGEATARERLARRERDEAGNATTRDLQYTVARELGFENWDHLQAHVSPSPDWWSRPNIRDVFLDSYYEKLKSGESGAIRAAGVIESAGKYVGNISCDLKQTLLAAEAAAGEAGQAEVTVERLLLHLLDNPVSHSVLARADCDIPQLRERLADAVGSCTTEDGPAPQISRHCFGVLLRASDVATLGFDEQINAANILLGIGQEDTPAAALLREQANETDLYHVVCHGIPVALPEHRPPDYVPLAEEAQRVFMRMKRSSRSLGLFTLEQLLRAMLDHCAFDAVDRNDLDSALAEFIDRTTPRRDTTGRSIVRPTLAFDHVTKMAVARSRRRGEPAGTLDLLRAILGERHGFAVAELARRGITVESLP